MEEAMEFSVDGEMISLKLSNIIDISCKFTIEQAEEIREQLDNAIGTVKKLNTSKGRQ